MYQNATREQIEELLRQGLSNSAIVRQLRVDKGRVRGIRGELGIPNPPQHPTLEEKWRARTVAREGGHLEWTGERVNASCTPVMRYREQYYSPTAIAFRVQHGRDPVGQVFAECGVRHCVAPGHVEDEPGRQRAREQLRYLTGGTARAERCANGHEQAVHGKYAPGGTAYCDRCKSERKETTP